MQLSSKNLVACSHCNLEFPQNVMIKETLDAKELHFCCNGCQGVYHLLKDDELDSFYDKLGSNKLHAVNEVSDNLAKYDLEGFSKKYITDKDGLNEISLIMQGIHCSACVWLNEKVLHKTDGIIDASINYTNLKAKILWDPEVIKLSEIILKIESIGYSAYPYDAKVQEDKANEAKREYYSRLIVGVFCTMNIMWIAIAQYAGYFSGISASSKHILNVAEFVLATPALFYTGWPYFKGAYYAFKNKIANMDTLIVIGTLSTYIYSIYATLSHTGEVYFDSVTMIITFIFIGKYLEVLSKKNAVDMLDNISSSIPEQVTLVKDGIKSTVDATQINIGDLIEVKAGEKTAIDGVVFKGTGSFNESSVSGESTGVYKKEGDCIVSGTINLDGVVIYKATKSASNSTLQSIATLLEESLTKKPNIEKLADEISGYFSLIVLIISISTFLGWLFVGASFEQALIIAISVTVIACPCALGLATPVATLVGVGVGAKKGILFKSASNLETMAKATTVVLDKTGTITNGKPDVINFVMHQEFDKNLLYSMVKSSNHPISKAIKSYLQKEETSLQEYALNDIKNLQSRGLSATYGSHILFGGNVELIKEMGVEFELESKSSIFVFAVDGSVVCYFELEDRLKDGAVDTIKNIKRLGLDIILCSGDNEYVVGRVAKELGLDKTYSNMFPTDKADVILELKKDKKIVIMVGDGINDALALSQSDIAIAMGNTTDLAVKASDIVFINNKITTLYDAIKLSRGVFHIIKENFSLSLVYNVLTITFAVAGYVIPLVAAISMSFSSLVVVGNSMRIKRIFKNG